MLEAKAPPPGVTVLIINQAHDALTADLRDAQAELDTAQAAHRAIPAKAADGPGQPRPAGPGRPNQADHPRHPYRRVQHRPRPGLRHPRPHRLRPRRREAHALARQALTGSGDIDPLTVS